MDTGMHVKELESVSLYDAIRKKWADRVTGITSVVDKPFVRAVEQTSGKQSSHSRQMGWALKMTKEKKRFEERVKSYLIDKFEKGERSVNKADPISVSKEMKMKRDGDGKLYFEPSEWKSAQQIKGFFSRYSAKLRQTAVGEEVFTEEDMEACEAEMIRQHLRDVIDNDIQKPEHHFVVDVI